MVLIYRITLGLSTAFIIFFCRQKRVILLASMPNEICDKDHSAVLGKLEQLPISQAPSRGRHRCAGCAYEEGFEAGKKAAGGGHGGSTTTPPLHGHGPT
jgi:hypothetical protein